MGKIIEIIGNTGAGKTTLAHSLTKTGLFGSGIEQHQERPFHARMAANHTRYALANQVDYLLLRAEQEKLLRKQVPPGILDGGLEEDFFLFTQFFFDKSYLDRTEFGICERLYRFLRDSLGPPDLVIWIDVPLSVTQERFQQRKRYLEIAQVQDLEELEKILQTWLRKAYGFPLVRVDGDSDIEQITQTTLELIEEYHILA